MSLTLTITADTIDDLRAKVAETLGLYATSVNVAGGAPDHIMPELMPRAVEPTVEEPKAEKPKRTTKPKELVRAVDDAVEEPKQDTPGIAEAEPAITYDDVRKLVLELSKDPKTRPDVRAVLATFDVDHATKLTESQWPAAHEALAKLAGVEAVADEARG